MLIVITLMVVMVMALMIVMGLMMIMVSIDTMSLGSKLRPRIVMTTGTP
jgi:hypothetical protein